MRLSPDFRRRWLGGMCLAIAGLMLILGLTLFKDRMPPGIFIIYWLVCMLMTFFTMIIALLDLRAVRLRSKEEERNLARTILHEFTDEDAE